MALNSPATGQPTNETPRAAKKPSPDERSVPEERAGPEANSEDLPSFALRPPPARSDPFVVAAANGRDLSRASMENGGPWESAERLDLRENSVASRLRRPVRHTPRLLVLMGMFAAGVVAGVGGTRLVDADLPLDSYVQGVQRAAAPLTDVATARRNGSAASSLADAPHSRPTLPPVDGIAHSPTDANQAPGYANNPEISALTTKFELQLAEGRLDQPEGDNALQTYRKIAEIAPNDAATEQLGQRLSASFWSLASQARAAKRWDDALRYYAVLRLLPPVPVAAFSAKDDREPAAGDTTSVALAPAPPTPGEAAAASPMPAPLPKTVAPTNPVQPAPSAVSIAVPATTGMGNAGVAPARAVQPSAEVASSDGNAAPALANAQPAAPSPGTRSVPIALTNETALATIAMARGNYAIRNGDVISARGFYQLAAGTGLARAATAVGRTYDPVFLQANGVRGALADIEAAKRWYQKAIDGGDAEARGRLDQLPRRNSDAH
jgi:tetratricopeptide (TPR) repeat protein